MVKNTGIWYRRADYIKKNLKEAEDMSIAVISCLIRNICTKHGISNFYPKNGCVEFSKNPFLVKNGELDDISTTFKRQLKKKRETAEKIKKMYNNEYIILYDNKMKFSDFKRILNLIALQNPIKLSPGETYENVTKQRLLCKEGLSFIIRKGNKIEFMPLEKFLKPIMDFISKKFKKESLDFIDVYFNLYRDIISTNNTLEFIIAGNHHNEKSYIMSNGGVNIRYISTSRDVDAMFLYELNKLVLNELNKILIIKDGEW